MNLIITRSTETDNWIRKHHYLHSTPAGARVRMKFCASKSEIQEIDSKMDIEASALILRNGWYMIGAMLRGRPNFRRIDQTAIMELTRCRLLDFMPENTESRALEKSRAWIRKNMPSVKGLIAYAFSGERHKGAIYLADGWFKISESGCIMLYGKHGHGREMQM